MFSTKLNSMLAAKRETNKVPRNHTGKIVSGQPITEQEIYGKITEHKSEQSKSSKEDKISASGKHVLKKSDGKSSEKSSSPQKGKKQS